MNHVMLSALLLLGCWFGVKVLGRKACKLIEWRWEKGEVAIVLIVHGVDSTAVRLVYGYDNQSVNGMELCREEECQE